MAAVRSEAAQKPGVADADIGAHGAAFVVSAGVRGEQQRRAERGSYAPHDEANTGNLAQAIVAVHFVVGARSTLGAFAVFVVLELALLIQHQKPRHAASDQPRRAHAEHGPARDSLGI